MADDEGATKVEYSIATTLAIAQKIRVGGLLSFLFSFPGSVALTVPHSSN